MHTTLAIVYNSALGHGAGMQIKSDPAYMTLDYRFPMFIQLERIGFTVWC